jgi:alpha-N-arabinofuranosidase
MQKYCILSSIFALIISSCSVKPPAEGSIVIDMDRKGAEVPSSMYGVFFEEINHAGHGGHYAELVQNRSFEEKEYPEGYFAEGDKLHAPPLKNHLTMKVSEETYRWNTEDIPGWSLESAVLRRRI